MKPTLWVTLVLLASTSACATSAASPASAPGSVEAAAEVPPIPTLMDRRERLVLTESQMAALEEIAREWATSDYEIRRRAGTLKPANPLAITVALRPGASGRAAVEANNQRAFRAVEQVLTPEQRRAVCLLPNASRAARTDSPARQPTRLTSRSHQGTAASAAVRQRWPWCTVAGTGRLLTAQQQ
jgi:hypothetical protein